MRTIPPDIVEALRRRTAELVPELCRFRRELHAHPEIALGETDTRRRIAGALTGTSLRIRPPLLGTDLIADLGDGERTVCLRADIDALPMDERSGLEYRSQAPGKMHACGHDGHAACLLGACLVLDSIADRLDAGVRFVFQPGEEVVAAGADLVRLGACEGVDAAYALHGRPGLGVGIIATRAGTFHAAADFFHAEIVGAGCHGSMPVKGLNPIPVAADAAARLAELHDRVHADDGSVVSVCSFHAGTGSNIIPDRAVLEGTVRYLDAGRGRAIEADIRQALASAVERGGATLELDYRKPYPLPVINDQGSVETIRQLVGAHLPGYWREWETVSMAAEDFAFFLQDRAGAMFYLGLGEDAPELHTPTFDFNDGALENGILMLCLLALAG